MRISRTNIPALRLALAVALALLVLATLVWLGQGGASMAPASASTTPNIDANAIRIGVVPERDIFAQRHRYLALADDLSRRLGRPVHIVTGAAYQDILEDFATNNLDAAFLGSFSTVLACDRLHAHIVARPVLPGEISTYRGVIIVPAQSSIQTIDDLRGRSIALVRTTMAAHLFPFAELQKRGLLATDAKVRHVFVGTHDDVILDLADGRVDAGAVKDLRLNEYERVNGTGKFRRLLTSASAPENALIARQALDQATVAKLSDALLAMKDDAKGKAALETFGAIRFEPCGINDYKAIYDQIAALGPAWPSLGIAGDPPTLPPPASAPAP